MLISSSSDIYSGISTVATDTLGGFWAYIAIIIGVILAFFVLEMLLKILYPDRFKNEIEYIEK